ncbi:MAG: hypothetical protein KAH33_05085 [Candidatus Delongbacteria bacterium]|nr:hypothetical protein [Candidatus Delongbacteria bacterium]
MKSIVVFIILLLLFDLSAIESDSTNTKSSFRYMKTQPPEKMRYKAIIYSAFLPGAGHFYLDNNKAGWSYLTARLMIIPGVLLSLNPYTGPFDPNPKPQWKIDLGRGLIIFSMAAWVADVLHAGISAGEFDKPIQEETSKNISYRIITNFEKKRLGLGLTYCFK